MKSFFGLALAAAGLLAACGGDVKVDGEAGNARGGEGGAGASGSASSSSSTSSSSPTTSTGPVPSTSNTGPTPACDCFGACQKLSSCFGEDIPCDSFCNDVPADVSQCICNTPDCNVDFCFGGTGGSSTGGAPTALCEDCIQVEVNSTCNQQFATCANDPACAERLNCHANCGWDPGCNDECAALFPDPQGMFHALANCIACGVCLPSCVRTWLGTYCALGGP